MSLLRPRSPLVLAGLGDCALGLAIGVAARRLPGRVRLATTAAGAAVAAVGVGSFWCWTRVREVRVDRRGIRLRGLGLSVSLAWTDLTFVRAERVGPTTFLVAQAAAGRDLPLLSPFRWHFAALLGVGEPSRLLVLRTTDFTGGAAAFGAALETYAPPYLAVDWCPSGG